MNIENTNFELPNLRAPVVIIIGPPGAGKTAVGKQLAIALNWDFYDTDALIEEATSMKIATIFSQSEKLFRQLEKNLLKKFTETFKNNKNDTKSTRGTIISCGGGLPVPKENFDNLKLLGKIVCLNAPIIVLMERVAHVTHRPLLNASNESTEVKQNPHSERLSKLETLLVERQEVYAQAEYQINTGNQSVEQVVTTIRTLLKL